mmetsp:Transcript_48972/g.122736  ORF Transcript_48972/g.122736 Transcript_48972/m.122736 type:complete len:151 (+) Transcript_48972:146-598(+)
MKASGESPQPVMLAALATAKRFCADHNQPAHQPTTKQSVVPRVVPPSREWLEQVGFIQTQRGVAPSLADSTAKGEREERKKEKRKREREEERRFEEAKKEETHPPRSHFDALLQKIAPVVASRPWWWPPIHPHSTLTATTPHHTNGRMDG